MQAWRSTRELFLFSTLIDKSPLTSNISQLLKRKEKSGLPYPHNRTFWFLVNTIYIIKLIKKATESTQPVWELYVHRETTSFWLQLFQCIANTIHWNNCNQNEVVSLLYIIYIIYIFVYYYLRNVPSYSVLVVRAK